MANSNKIRQLQIITCFIFAGIPLNKANHIIFYLSNYGVEDYYITPTTVGNTEKSPGKGAQVQFYAREVVIN